MHKILINAYACSPNMGSEPGMAWNWCVNLARHCELHVITEGEFREQIEAAVLKLEYGKNLHFYYNPVSERIRKMCWNQGDWRFYIYYKKWQKKTAEIARDICKREKIDVLHQLNMIGFRESGYLWQVSQETGIPFVWGPVDAKEAFPMAYAEGASWKVKAFLRIKNIVTRYQLKYGRRVHKAASTASAVLSATSNSILSFRKYFGIDSILINETGTCPSMPTERNFHQKATFDILWVGKADFRKQLALAIRSIAIANQQSLQLHIVGNGSFEPYIKEAEELGIRENCIFHGRLSHHEVLKEMKEMDLLLFTSVAEGTPHVVLESISCGLPVLCFDTCGQGDSVTNDIGIKIPLTNPELSAKAFAGKIAYLSSHRNQLQQMSANCHTRAEKLSWENKAKEMVRIYENAIGKKNDTQTV